MNRAIIATAAATSLAALLLPSGTSADSRHIWGCKPGPAALATAYGMDQHGISAELIIDRDGGWEMYYIYKNRERHESGCWQARQGKVVLAPRHRKATSTTWHPDNKQFNGVAMTVKGKQLAWDLGHGRTGTFSRQF